MPIFDQEDLCLWQEGRGQCEVLAGESILWRHLWKVSCYKDCQRIPRKITHLYLEIDFLDVDSIIANGFVTVMIVDLAARSVGSRENFGKCSQLTVDDLDLADYLLPVCLPITPAPCHATHHRPAQKLNLAEPRSHLLALADASDNLHLAGEVHPTQAAKQHSRSSAPMNVSLLSGMRGWRRHWV
jgi:hypothetical protein